MHLEKKNCNLNFPADSGTHRYPDASKEYPDACKGYSNSSKRIQILDRIFGEAGIRMP